MIREGVVSLFDVLLLRYAAGESLLKLPSQ